MNATPKDPWEEIESLHRRVSELWDAFYRSPIVVGASEPAPAFIPEVDIVESSQSVRLYVALPGVLEEDLQIDLNAEELTVQGVRHPPFDPEGTLPLNRETRYGFFRRVVRLPAPVDPDSLRAYLSEGMLAIFLTRRRCIGPG